MIKYIKNKYCKKYQKIEDLLFKIDKRIYNNEDNDDIQKKLIYRKQELKEVIEIINSLILTVEEESLINNKILLLKGAAGVGKSHTFAINSNNMLKEDRAVLLFPGYNFLEKQAIKKQIMEFLNIKNYEFINLLSAFEGIGKLTDKKVVILFDGVNESDNNEFWKQAIEEFNIMLKDYEYIKIAFSFRNGFESQLISESVAEAIKNNIITLVEHTGLDNFNTEQINVFLDYYRITFSPSFYFYNEMYNPLFLTLFCENYDGNNFQIQDLFERTIKNIDKNSKKEIGVNFEFELLNDFIKEFTELMVNGNRWSINSSELLQLNFWERNGINKKHDYIESLIRNGLLNKFDYQNSSNYVFSYNLLRDFLMGKSIFLKSNSYDELEKNIKDILFYEQTIDESMIIASIFASEMGYESYGKEVILSILKTLPNDNSRIVNKIVDDFVKSYTIRKNKNINLKIFSEIIINYGVYVESFYDMLIDNSTKLENDLNADFLNNYLSPLSIVERDKE